MTARLNPYLNFRSSAREALTFYQSVFGGELQLMTFGEIGQTDDPSEADNIMHGQLETPNGMTLMAADTPKSVPLTEGGNISVALSGDEEATLRGYWDRLIAGGRPTVPIEKAPWGDTFGMLVDKFGINWLVNIAGPR